MCDDRIHQGVVIDVSRRAFGLMAAAAATATGGAAAAAGVVERDVEFSTADGVCDAVLCQPQGAGPWPGVLIWPDVLSLRPAYREIARRLAGAGYVVLAPNIYYRVRRAPVLDGAFDFGNPDDRGKLTALQAGLGGGGWRRDSTAYVTFLDGLPQVDRRRRMGVQGYCLGGMLAFLTASQHPDRVGAAASFHGGGLFTDSPNSPHLSIPRMKADVLVAIAEDDDEAEPRAREGLKAAFAAAGLTATVEVYAGANHGWCVPGGGAYNEAAAERAWAALLKLYAAKLA